MTLGDLRRYAIARTLFAPTTLQRAIDTLGFVQADPIRAPARAQDLTLRHRVAGLPRRRSRAPVPAARRRRGLLHQLRLRAAPASALMHPRAATRPWTPATKRRAQAMLDFVRERGTVHPRQVDEHFAHGTVTNYWGGSSNATTHLLDGMHYRGLLRVARRESGMRIYAAHEHARRRRRMRPRAARTSTRSSTSSCASTRRCRRRASRCSSGGCVTPRRNSSAELDSALARAKRRLAHVANRWRRLVLARRREPAPRRADRRPRPPARAVRSGGLGSAPLRAALGLAVSVRGVHAGATKRQFGYYALPLLWRDQVIGWANVAAKDRGWWPSWLRRGRGAPRDRVFRRELAAELARMQSFLRI